MTALPDWANRLVPQDNIFCLGKAAYSTVPVVELAGRGSLAGAVGVTVALGFIGFGATICAY